MPIGRCASDEESRGWQGERVCNTFRAYGGHDFSPNIKLRLFLHRDTFRGFARAGSACPLHALRSFRVRKLQLVTPARF